jgi:hypothetical protein
MTVLSNRLDRVIKSANQIIPVKVADGIVVGDVKIVSEDSIKHLWQNGKIVYKEVYLNAVAIKLANMLARRSNTTDMNKIYNADQNYGRLFVDSQILRSQYQRALNREEYDRADILWARYCESRDRAVWAKDQAQRLATI